MKGLGSLFQPYPSATLYKWRERADVSLLLGTALSQHNTTAVEWQAWQLRSICPRLYLFTALSIGLQVSLKL